MIKKLIKHFKDAGDDVFITKKAPWPVRSPKGYH